MTSVEKIQNEIVEELSLFTDWIEKYEYLIELGKDEIDFDKKFMKDEFLINGCQSKVILGPHEPMSACSFLYEASEMDSNTRKKTSGVRKLINLNS